LEGTLKEVLTHLHDRGLSGLLRFEAGVLPLEVDFSQGEVAGGRILDWEGFEALCSVPLEAEGVFRFEPHPPIGRPWMAFSALISEWTRLNQEWIRFRSLLDSPSRYLESPRPQEPYQVFFGGRSVRGAARIWGTPLIIAMERAWRGVREGDLVLLHKYAWYGLRIRHPRLQLPAQGSRGPLPLDGQHTLGDYIRQGYPAGAVRDFLIRAIVQGELQPSGRGWLLRDLLWEREQEAAR
jgi:hypothetical protein